MKKFIKNVILSILVVISIIFFYLFFVLFPSLSCIDSTHKISFIQNRITKTCSYSYTCSSDLIEKNPRVLYSPGCSNEDALNVLNKNVKNDTQIQELVKRCKSCMEVEQVKYTCDFVTQNPTLNCSEILDAVWQVPYKLKKSL